MTDYFGEAVLYRSATGLEKAWADVDVHRLLDIRAELVAENWDPWKVQAKNLPFLAYAMGVTLWDDAWDEQAKRYWIAVQWEFKARRGTERAYQMALEQFGFKLRQVVTPPQGFYASPDVTKEEYDAWVRLMPQVRIALASTPGTGGLNEFFAGDDFPSLFGDDLTAYLLGFPVGATLPLTEPGFIGSSFADEDVPALDDGPLLFGRKAFLRLANGNEVPLKTGTFTTVTEMGEITYVDEFSTQGKSLAGFCAEVDFADDAFADAAETDPELYRLNRSFNYSHTDSILSLTMARPTLTPMDTRLERDSDHGHEPASMFASADFADALSLGDSFATDDIGGLMLADRVYLFDPDVAVPMTAAWSFADVDRVGMPPFTVEALVDLQQSDPGPSTYAGEDSFNGWTFATSEDMKARDDAMRALVASSALRDTVLVSTSPRRPLEFGDDIAETTEVGDWVNDAL
jgi:phage tail P2-like protein